jgi:biotin carboxylase
MVPWGSTRMREQRRAHLRRLGPVEVVERPDQVVDVGLRFASETEAVVALSEIVSFYAGILANLLGVPANPPQALLATRHKDVQRELLERHGVPSPRARVLRDGDILAAAFGLIYPLILKPATGVGSLCVFRARDAEELATAYAQAIDRYKGDPRPNGTGPVFLVEEEITGRRWHPDARFGHQVSVESLVDKGVVHHLGTTDKFPIVSPFRESGHVSPSLLDPGQSSHAQRVAGDAIRALGNNTGAVHTELMLTADGPVVIEVNARLGGGVYELLKFTRDYDIVQAIVAVARGVAPQLPGPPSAYAAFVKPQPPEGTFRVTDIDAEGVASALALAEWGVLDKEPGSLVDSANGTNANLARFIARDKSSDGLFAKIDEIDRVLRRAVSLEAL